jgi:ABC-type polysaccharide/polyol phosphate transport system ATPase subunit
MITLHDVHVRIPVFLTDYSRALRTIIGERVFGGRLGAANGGKIMVNALRGVSLSIGSNERVGLIGPNGAGKTTLLRVIAGIIPVASGSVAVEGEIRSFFNLNAGLDLTRSGMANIEAVSMFYTRDRARIQETTPSIVEFAELGEFIHMPVYSYSAGMQARLLVSIATAYGGDILIFDEMLGAGDASFIAKVDKRIDGMIGAAKSMVIASHSTDMIRRLCNRAVWVEGGEIRMDGPVEPVIESYAQSQPA